MKNTMDAIDLFSKVLFVYDCTEAEPISRAQEVDIRRRAAKAAAAEVGCPHGVAADCVKLFSDCTGNYAEVILPGGYDRACGMKLCVMLDTDTMEVRGVCPMD